MRLHALIPFYVFIGNLPRSVNAQPYKNKNAPGTIYDPKASLLLCVGNKSIGRPHPLNIF